jgi:hypothetical protein
MASQPKHSSAALAFSSPVMAPPPPSPSASPPSQSSPELSHSARRDGGGPAPPLPPPALWSYVRLIPRSVHVFGAGALSLSAVFGSAVFHGTFAAIAIAVVMAFTLRVGSECVPPPRSQLTYNAKC